VFTPRGKIISLPRGATPVDFAYFIHTDIGNQAVAAKINGDFVPLRTELKSGDTVDIITSVASRPNAQWLNFVRTGRARSEIRHYLRTMKYAESVAFGERLLTQELLVLGLPLPEADDPIWEKLARASGANSREEILADIGLGKRLAAVVARRFGPGTDVVATTAGVVDEVTSVRSAPVLIQGNEGQSVQLAPGCTPIPGDALVGFIRLGHGLVVHTEDCPTGRRLRAREPDRWMDVGWDENTAHHLSTRVDVVARNERGVLGRIAAEVTAADSNITHVTTQDDTLSTVTMHFVLQVENREHLARVFRYLRRIPQVERIVRVKG